MPTLLNNTKRTFSVLNYGPDGRVIPVVRVEPGFTQVTDSEYKKFKKIKENQEALDKKWILVNEKSGAQKSAPVVDPESREQVKKISEERLPEIRTENPPVVDPGKRKKKRDAAQKRTTEKKENPTVIDPGKRERKKSPKKTDVMKDFD